MYSRTVGGRALTFGHEGVLYRSSFILYDRETLSLWVHTTGEAVKGALKGKHLEFLPSVVTTWKAWKERYPDSQVLEGARARGQMGVFNLGSAPGRYGLSVGQGTRPKLYPIDILKRKTVINDEVDGKKVVVVFASDSATGAAYERGDRTFEWKDGTMKDASGGVWDLLTGSSDRQALTPLPATPWLIDRWRGFYPLADVYKD